jgi:chitinase
LQICASATSTSPITVTYTTSNGTATSGSDYTTTTGTATIPAGQTCVNVTIPIIDDTTGEPTETFNVTLTNPSGATIADGTGVVTILDNDSATGPASVGNFVWNDANNNGIQDQGELGIAGVSVNLYTSTGSWAGYAQTDASGAYLFSNVAPGSYKICFNLPWGYSNVSPKDQGSNDATDSDVNAVSGGSACTDVFTVAAGQNITTIDAGMNNGTPTPTQPTISINDITVTEGVNPTATLQILFMRVKMPFPFLAFFSTLKQNQLLRPTVRAA